MARAGKTSTPTEHERRYRELLTEITEIGFICAGSVAPRFESSAPSSTRLREVAEKVTNLILKQDLKV